MIFLIRPACRPGKCAWRERADPRRLGFSLMEVVIATALLMGSAVVLSRLAGMGREQAVRAAVRTELQQVCQQTMQEILLGERPAGMIEDAPWEQLRLPPTISTGGSTLAGETSLREEPAGAAEGTPEFRYSVRIAALPAQPGMWSLTVEVAEGDQQQQRRQRFSLTQWIAGEPEQGAFQELDLRSPDSVFPVSPSAGENP